MHRKDDEVTLKQHSRRSLAIRRNNRIATFLSETGRSMIDVLKWPILLGLVTLEGLTVLIAIGIVLQLATYGFLAWIAGAAGWLVPNSPIMYKTWRKIKEEDGKAKIMQEGWEGTEDMKKAVQEYRELLAEQAKSKSN